ncbi:MAG TPA: DUF4252 domain-containing protein [Candidatus Angelobacter sp.]|nr:DUF4252 domain-containing protein [Candidatus Angelobacter sp.]
MRELFKRTWNCKAWAGALLCTFLMATACAAQNGRLELKNLDKLSSKAADVNDITLDGAMLELAGNFMGASHEPDAEMKNVLKGLKGIYIKNFEFDEPNQYSQEDVEAIRAQLTGPGWTRIVESRSRRSKEHDEIYILKQGDKVAGLVILVAEPKELTVVNIVGFIDVNKLGTLEGHFGIPGDESRHREKKQKPDQANPPANKASPDNKGNDDDAEA